MGLARGGAGGRGGGRGSGRGVHKKARGGPMMRPGPPPLMGPPGPHPPMGGPRMRPPPPGMMHQPPGVRPPPPGMRPPRPPPHGMVRPPPGFRPPPPGPHGPHGPHGHHGPHGPHGPHGHHGHHGLMGPMGPMGPHGPRMGPPGMPPRPPPPGMMRGRGGMMRPPMIPPWVGPPRPPGPPGGPFMMRAAREWRRGGMAGKGGKHRKIKSKSGTNRPQAELEAAELAKPWVNDVIRPEILKKHKLHAEARASKDVKDWEAFKEQKKKVAVMVNEAKLEYIGSHPEEETDEEEDFDAESSFGSYEEEDCADSSFEEESTGYVENTEESSQNEWQWPSDSSYNNYDYSQSSLEGGESSSTASSSANYYQNSVEQYPSYDASQYQSQDNNAAYESYEGEGYEGYEGYKSYEAYNGYNGWYDPASQSYYSSAIQDPQQYYGVSGQDTTQNQWYNHQSYEQSHTSYQQYAVPYQVKTENQHSWPSSSHSFTPRENKNRPFNTHNSNYNRQQGHRRRDEPLTLFYCDSCDRSFPNDEQLKEHLSEHRVCGREGCKFTAHAKVVEKHIRLQHDTGLYRRIKSTDDTEKWRAERKKKFPSKENIEARQKQQQEMLSRGERLDFEQNRFQNSRGRSNMGGRGRGARHNNSNIPPRYPAIKQEREDAPHPSMPWRPQFPLPVVEDIELITRGKLSKFPGTEFYKSDEEKVEEAMSACGALNTLCDYGAESSEEEEAEDKNEKGEEAVSTNDKNNSEKTVDVAESTEAAQAKDDVVHTSTPEEGGISTSETTPHPKPTAEEKEYESDGSSPEELPVLKEVADNTEAEVSAPCNEAKKRKLDESEPNDDQKHNKYKKGNNDFKSKGNFKQRGKENNSFHRGGKPMPRRPPTLLEKLLAPDIHHERNIILQCVRYVVEQKFFNVSQKTPEIQATPAK